MVWECVEIRKHRNSSILAAPAKKINEIYAVRAIRNFILKRNNSNRYTLELKESDFAKYGKTKKSFANP